MRIRSYQLTAKLMRMCNSIFLELEEPKSYKKLFNMLNPNNMNWVKRK